MRPVLAERIKSCTDSQCSAYSQALLSRPKNLDRVPPATETGSTSLFANFAPLTRICFQDHNQKPESQAEKYFV